MTRGPIRRAQLIAPFGVGAMVVVRDGTSLICCGLDHWYKRDGHQDDSRDLDLDEFRVEEWRLQNRLKVSHFRLPPDYRIRKYREEIPNSDLKVPFLRFPQWHFCPFCNYLFKLPLSRRGRVKCRKCESKGINRYLVQVPFVAMCEAGHLQDFPWREWVHGDGKPECSKDMRLVATGGATLSGQVIKCDCGEKRSLLQIMAADTDGTTFLSKNLYRDGSKTFYCQGKKPWHGTEIGDTCTKHLRGSLRSASNIYFAHVKSSIYLPRGNEDTPSELITILEEPPLSTLINLVSGAGESVTPEILRSQQRDVLQPYTDMQIKSALTVLFKGISECQDAEVQEDDWEIGFRRDEYNLLKTERDEDMLRIRKANLSNYDAVVTKYFSKIMLVDKLRETRALSGFTRVYAENSQTPAELQALMQYDMPSENDTWLPAYIVYGEGLFLVLDESRLQNWEQRYDVIARVKPLAERYQRVQHERKMQERALSPRFVLLHTLSHLLINRLTFECGYSSASLRERLYVSDNRNAPMAGILIYTASGDSEGTMGGLVRMGQPGYLELLIQRALEGARWCSADPVCMEIGNRGGQGPDSCNLAACHNCALVPETACEEFNRLLDRALVVGAIGKSGIGYFRTQGGIDSSM